MIKKFKKKRREKMKKKELDKVVAKLNKVDGVLDSVINYKKTKGPELEATFVAVMRYINVEMPDGWKRVPDDVKQVFYDFSRPGVVDALIKMTEAEVIEEINLIDDKTYDELIEALVLGIDGFEGSNDDLQELLPGDVIDIFMDITNPEIVEGIFVAEEEEAAKEEEVAEEEKKEPLKKVNKSKETSELKLFLKEKISEGKYTRKEIVKMAMEVFPSRKSSVATYLTDGKNPKYNIFSQLVIQANDEILSFEAGE